MTAPISRAGANAASARFGIVLVHGRGATAEGMLDLGAALGLPDVALAAPQAPGHSWWPSSFLAPMAQMDAPLARGLSLVEEAVDTLVSDGLATDRIAVLGFSQGACLALEYAARRGAGLGAVFGLSGGLVGSADTGGGAREDLYGHASKAFDYDTDLSGTFVRISVHERDPHIPLVRALESATVFRSLGAEVQTEIFPGAGHGIAQGDIKAIRAVLNG